MKNKLKVLVSLFLATVMMVVISVPVSAVQPRFNNLNDIWSSLYISGGSATCRAHVEGVSGTTAIINGSARLVNNAGTTVASWSNLYATGDTLDFYNSSVRGLSKGTYTFYFSATIVKDEKPEAVSTSSSYTYA